MWGMVAAQAAKTTGGMIKLFGDYQGSKYRQKGYAAEESTAMQNYEITKNETNFNEDAQRRFYAQQLAGIGAQQAQAGLSGDLALFSYMQSKKEAELDTLNNRLEGQITMTNFLNQAINARNAQRYEKRSRRFGVAAGVLSMGGDIASGIGK